MPFKSASSLTKFSKTEIELLFSSIKLKYRKLGLEILLAPISLDYGRMLICVARRFGNAPDRNLFKRRLRSIFYEEQLFKKEFDWVFVVKSKAGLKLDFNSLKNTIYDALQQASKQNK